MILTSRHSFRRMAIVLAACAPGILLAQGNSASQSVVLEVRPVTKIVVTGNPGTLLISDFPAGVPLVSVQDHSTSYSMITNVDPMKIVASIDQPMPSGTRLLVEMGSTGGVSAGTVDLSNAISPVNVVTGISKGTQTEQTISYTFAADAGAGEIPTQSRTITLTLTN